MENNSKEEEIIIPNDFEVNIEINQKQIVWYVLSIISWVLFICCQIESYINDSSMFFNRRFYFFSIYQ